VSLYLLHLDHYGGGYIPFLRHKIPLVGAKKRFVPRIVRVLFHVENMFRIPPYSQIGAGPIREMSITILGLDFGGTSSV
jgi:hypothetical protein